MTPVPQATEDKATRGYRPDIDGLRAVSVVAVVLYHVSPDLVPGGFLGVDVFFVISGFLIGGMLIDELEDATFSFRGFYLRRFRRLMPALSVVLVACAAVSSLVYAPQQLTQAGGNALASLFGWANIRYSFQDPYAAIESGTNPLLHMWSLGVEEQFYLLIPGFLWLLWRLLSRRSAIRMLACVLVLSFVASLYLGRRVSEQDHFFWITSRAWEMLAGVLLAAVVAGGELRLGRISRTALVGCGFASIMLSFVFLDRLETGPGAWTLLPILGAVAVIAGGPDNAFSAGLALRVPVEVGLLSYPLYLWHYPLLAFWSEGSGRDGIGERLGVVAVSVLLSVLTLRLVERPIRRSRSPRRWVPALMALFVAVLVTNGAVVISKGLPQRLDDMPSVGEGNPVFGPNLVTPGSGPAIVVVGDSHMADVAKSISVIEGNGDRGVAEWVESGCQFLLGLERANRSTGRTGRCTVDLQMRRLEWIDSFPGSTVVLGGRLPLFVEGTRFDNGEGGIEGSLSDYLRTSGTSEYEQAVSREQISESLGRTLDVLEANGHRVVLVYPIPEVGVNVPAVLAQRTILNWFNWPIDDPLTTSYTAYLARTARTFEMLDGAGSEATIRVYPAELFCDTVLPGRCVTHSDEAIFYRDSHHLSTAGLELLAEAITKAIAAAR